MGRLWELVEDLDMPSPEASPQDRGMPHETMRSDPKKQLAALLTAWASMDESQWTPEAVDRLKNDILDVFRDHPDQADGWYRAWRRLHPEARLW